MPDVLLVNPYVLSHHAHHITTYRPYPPLGLMSAAAVLRTSGYSVEIYDGTFQPGTRPLVQRLTQGLRPRIVYLQAMSSFRSGAVAAVELMKEIGLTVVVGGPDPSIYDAQYLESGADVVVRCQVEVALPLILEAFGLHPEQPEQLPRRPAEAAFLEIPGVSFLDGDVRHRRSPERVTARALGLGVLPMPAYDLVDVERYATEWRRVHGHASLQLATSRACPFSCIWCARVRAGRGYGPEAAGRVVDEVEHVVRRHGIEHLALTDDTFLSRRDFALAFADELRRRGVRVAWECRGRIDAVDYALLERMRDAGCERINFGIESGSERVLGALKKGSSVDDARKVARDMHALGIAMGGYVLFGYPGEDWSDIERTISLICEIAPIDYSTSVAYPVPGTELYDLVRGMMHANDRWVEEEPDALEWDAPYSPTFYRAVDGLLAAEYDLALEFSVDRYAKAKILRALLAAMRWLGEGRILRFEGWRRPERPHDVLGDRPGEGAAAPVRDLRDPGEGPVDGPLFVPREVEG